MEHKKLAHNTSIAHSQVTHASDSNPYQLFKIKNAFYSCFLLSAWVALKLTEYASCLANKNF